MSVTLGRGLLVVALELVLLAPSRGEPPGRSECWGGFDQSVTVLRDGAYLRDIGTRLLRTYGLRGVLVLTDRDLRRLGVKGTVPRTSQLAVVARPGREAMALLAAAFPPYRCEVLRFAEAEVALLWPDDLDQGVKRTLLEKRSFLEQLPPLTPAGTAAEVRAARAAQAADASRGPAYVGACPAANLVEQLLDEARLPNTYAFRRPEQDDLRVPRGIRAPIYPLSELRAAPLSAAISLPPAQESLLARLGRVLCQEQPCYLVLLVTQQPETWAAAAPAHDGLQILWALGSAKNLAALPLSDFLAVVSAATEEDLRWWCGDYQNELRRRGEPALRHIVERYREFRTPGWLVTVLPEVITTPEFLYSQVARDFAEAAKSEPLCLFPVDVWLANIQAPGVTESIRAYVESGDRRRKDAVYSRLRACHFDVDPEWRKPLLESCHRAMIEGLDQTAESWAQGAARMPRPSVADPAKVKATLQREIEDGETSAEGLAALDAQRRRATDRRRWHLQLLGLSATAEPRYLGQ